MGKCIISCVRSLSPNGLPLDDDDTISLDMRDWRLIRDASRAEPSLLRKMHATKSSFVAPVACVRRPEGPCRPSKSTKTWYHNFKKEGIQMGQYPPCPKSPVRSRLPVSLLITLARGNRGMQ